MLVARDTLASTTPGKLMRQVRTAAVQDEHTMPSTFKRTRRGNEAAAGGAFGDSNAKRGMRNVLPLICRAARSNES